MQGPLELALSSYASVQIRCTAEEWRLSNDVAIPLALVVNELVTNAAKHGYPAGTKGQIRVSFKKDGNAVIASVADDAPLPRNWAAQADKGLGMRLIASLVKQLRGTFAMVPDGAGKAFVARVPV